MRPDVNPDLERPPPCRECWANCGVESDAEMREIDRLEDEFSPLPENITRIRKLISTLALCHHKAERWVTNIIEAIGEGDTSKGLGTRTAGGLHPAERDWVSACTALSAWCAEKPAASIEIKIGGRSARDLLSKLGQRSALKEWQVQRVVERIRERMQAVCRTLQCSLQCQRSEIDVDSTLLALPGDITAPQRWLVASLDKTIRLQLGL